MVLFQAARYCALWYQGRTFHSDTVVIDVQFTAASIRSTSPNQRRHGRKVYLISGPNKAMFAPNRLYFSGNDIYTGFIALETFYTILDMVDMRSSEPHRNGLEKRPKNAFILRVTLSGPVFRAKSVILFGQAFRMCQSTKFYVLQHLGHIRQAFQ